jgi:hypothetical protein
MSANACIFLVRSVTPSALGITMRDNVEIRAQMIRISINVNPEILFRWCTQPPAAKGAKPCNLVCPSDLDVGYTIAIQALLPVTKIIPQGKIEQVCDRRNGDETT